MSETHIEAPATEHDVAVAEAVAEAQVEIAEAQAEAAVEIAEAQAEVARDLGGELSECQTQLASVTQRLDGLQADHERMAVEHQAMLDQLSLIQSQQETPPANPQNPENVSVEVVPPEAEPEPEQEAEEPKPPERRRAHRWI